MRKLRYGMMMSLDGYVAGPENGPSLPVPDADLHWHFNEQVRETGLMVFGRRMYEVMRFWDAETPPGAPEVEADFRRVWRQTPKLVVSSMLKEVGPNAELLTGDIVAGITRRKQEDGADIEVAGPELAAHLARAGLIDEFRLYFLPVVLGGGKPFFAHGLDLELQLVDTHLVVEGVTMLRYHPVR